MGPRSIKLDSSERFTRLLPGAPETRAMKSGLVALKPGEAVGEHVTSGREEAIVILEGEAEVYVNGLPAFRSAAKSLVYIPPETPHDVRNCGDQLLRYIYIVVPA